MEINIQSICRDHSQFVQHGNIRMISTFSVLTSFMQVLIIIGGGGAHVCVLGIPVLDEMSTFHDISFGLWEMNIASLMLLPGLKSF